MTKKHIIKLELTDNEARFLRAMMIRARKEIDKKIRPGFVRGRTLRDVKTEYSEYFDWNIFWTKEMSSDDWCKMQDKLARYENEIQDSVKEW